MGLTSVSITTAGVQGARTDSGSQRSVFLGVRPIKELTEVAVPLFRRTNHRAILGCHRVAFKLNLNLNAYSHRLRDKSQYPTHGILSGTPCHLHTLNFSRFPKNYHSIHSYKLFWVFFRELSSPFTTQPRIYIDSMYNLKFFHHIPENTFLR